MNYKLKQLRAKYKAICKQGERSDLTGCTPAYGETGTPNNKPKKQTNQKKPNPTKEKRTPKPKLSEKAQRAKAAHKLVDSGIQRYAEEHNEPAFAKAMGGVSFPNGEPIDVAIPGADGKVAFGVELKTMVDNKNGAITMNRYAQIRKIEWERTQEASFHTVVLDDQKVYDPNGNHDQIKRRIFYRRGVGSFRVEGMFEIKGGEEELKKLMALEDDKLPGSAQRTDAKNRIGKWKFFTDKQGKGYKNSKTGEIVRPKK